jgi:hypothetical protein
MVASGGSPRSPGGGPGSDPAAAVLAVPGREGCGCAAPGATEAAADPGNPTVERARGRLAYSVRDFARHHAAVRRRGLGRQPGLDRRGQLAGKPAGAGLLAADHAAVHA